jgi:N-hydroxyarylamine O-acetyltransferase
LTDLHSLSSAQVCRYLERIGLRGQPAPTLRTLFGLQRAHLRSVPFENLDIHWQRPLSLADGALFEKIVERRRGGICYELNGLFATLLSTLGFEVNRVSATVFNAQGQPGPDFDHMALLVELERETWLVDVGFGDSFSLPLRISRRRTQYRSGVGYTLAVDGDEFIVSAAHPEYRFHPRPRAIEDFAGMCRFHQTSPDSHFTRKIVCSRATPRGRVTISGDESITTDRGVRHVTPLRTPLEFDRALADHFGIRR